MKGEIIVFEPSGGLSDELARGLMVELAASTAQIERARTALEQRMRYAAVMRLVPNGDAYVLFRMTYRGEGGWSRWALDRGPLERLAPRYLPQIGTSRFFELH